jgi:hypothetical protein
LIGVPWRVAFALQADGWYLRSDIIWYKPNCQPESVKDRPTRAHEYMFLFSKSEKYYYDAESITRPSKDIVRVWTKIVYNKLKDHKINFMIVGSTSLILQGIDVKANDIDIITDKKGAEGE